MYVSWGEYRILLLEIELYIVNGAPVASVAYHINADGGLAILDLYITDSPLLPIVPASVCNYGRLLTGRSAYHESIIMLSATALSPAGNSVFAIL